MRTIKPKSPLEKVIQNSICEYLTLKRYFFGRSNTTPVFDQDKGFYRSMGKYAVAGFPDIWLIKDGQFIGIEVKRPGGKQSEGQIEFERRCKEAGGQYYVATSIDDIVKLGL